MPKSPCSARLNQRHLRRYRCGLVVTIDGHGLPLLKHFAETLGKRLSRFTYNLSRKYIAHSVLYHLTLLIPIVSGQLREVLKA